MEVFLNRTKRKLGEKIEEKKVNYIFKQIRESFKKYSKDYKDMASKISKFLLKFSEDVENIEPKSIEDALNHIVLFSKTICELTDVTRTHINDDLFKRSGRKIRNLVSLLDIFVTKAKKGDVLKDSECTFEDILSHSLGKRKEIVQKTETPSIHLLVHSLGIKGPIIEEHFQWMSAISNFMPQYLSTLYTDRGQEIIKHIKNGIISQDQIVKGFRNNVKTIIQNFDDIAPHKLIEMVKKQVLTDMNKDRELTKTIALLIFSKIFNSITTGSNAKTRVKMIQRLVKERKSKSIDDTTEIDLEIEKLIRDDLKDIKEKSKIIREVVSVLDKKKIYIPIFQYIKDYIPNEILKVFMGKEPFLYIGKIYVDVDTYQKLKTFLNDFLRKMQHVETLFKKFTEESSAISLDKETSFQEIQEFFKTLEDLNNNIAIDRFYEYNISYAEGILYLNILKYLIESLKKVFEIIENISERKGSDRIIFQSRFLNMVEKITIKAEIENLEKKIESTKEDKSLKNSQLIIKWKELLKKKKSDEEKFTILITFLQEIRRSMKKFYTRVIFAKKLFTLAKYAKKIHPNLPAALAKSFDVPETFYLHLNQFLKEMRKLSMAMPQGDLEKRHESIQEMKDFIDNLFTNEQFVAHVKNMRQIIDKK